MATEVINTRVDAKEKRLFEILTRSIGTSPQNAIKIFITSFNNNRGFPYEIKSPYGSDMTNEDIEDYEEANDVYDEYLKDPSEAVDLEELMKEYDAL
ncbi:MAG: type II toxin-antitoxin system RelB/DinJ family antitoxin [Candidatus Ancillula sp.]|jgi:DNA-damage-inducible protein J|nr:type II toxin-antitoxin system RelB/DinJ family antitoxin [Candidatus Ancillula sp.]